MPKIIWTKQEEEILKRYYNEPDGISKILELTNKCRKQILTKGKYMGYRLVNFSTKDEEFFNIPNNLNSYIVGFLAGDGWMGYSKYGTLKMGINLSKKDRDHLVKIKNILKFDGKIHDQTKIRTITNKYKSYTKEYSNSRINITKAEKWQQDISRNWNLWTDLNDFKKSSTLKPPNLLTLELELSYINGLVDADGHVVLIDEPNHISGKSLKIGLIATKEMAEWVKNIYDTITPINQNRSIVLTESKNMRTYAISGVRAYWISKMILTLNLPNMERKWKQAKEFIYKIENEFISDVMIKRLNQYFSPVIYNFLLKYNIKIPYFITERTLNSVKSNNNPEKLTTNEYIINSKISLPPINNPLI